MTNYTDIELLELLEENGYEPSYSNLIRLKKDLESGAVVINEAAEEQEEIADDSVKSEEQKEVPAEESADNQTAPSTVVNLSSTGEVSISKDNKQIVADTEGNIMLSLAEYASRRNTEAAFKSFLIEDCNMSIRDYEFLKEETKVESVKTIAANLLKSIEEKLNMIDTSIADKSRGDIKQLRELDIIQDCITKLEALIERDQTALPMYSEAIKIIIKALLNINLYNHVFKEAYRSKKTLLILKYESLILAIISSISYLISTVISFENDTVHLKPTNEDILEFTGIKTLAAFNKSVESGEFKVITKDINILREFYLEVPIEQMSSILENYEYMPMIIAGIQNIYKQVVGENSNKITNLLYRVAGIVVLIFSLRDMFYTMFRMKTKFSDITASLQNFAGLNNGSGVLSKLSAFANKFKNDATFSSELATREIEDENQKILGQVKEINVKPQMPEVSNSAEPAATNPDSWSLDF